jgi:hypothetical protein
LITYSEKVIEEICVSNQAKLVITSILQQGGLSAITGKLNGVNADDVK